MQDTIAAIATPSGVGGICIVRVSGELAPQIAQAITKDQLPTPRYAALRTLYDTQGALIDEAIVLYFAAPRSYTCEEVVEFQCHGGEIIGSKILSQCLALGARIARAGEFTKRAYLNGRLDLAQANAIAQMIATRDASFQSALAKQLKGDLGAFVKQVRTSLINALAHTEVMIDYSEEDIPSDIITRIHSMLDALATRLNNIYTFSKARPNQCHSLCLIGKPNVGKSSLLNALLLYDRAITSPIAGTTRDSIEEELLIGPHRVRLIDTAGIHQSTDPLESKGIEKSLQALQEASIILVVFDGSSPLDTQDEAIIALVQGESASRQSSPKILPIINKCDLPSRLDSATLQSLESTSAATIAVNALDKSATASILYSAIAQALAQESYQDIILSAPYQQEAIAQTQAHIQSACTKLDSLELELFAYHIKDALESIGHITHPYNSEEVLDSMFGQFCLGK